jgi:hypothetical protein
MANEDRRYGDTEIVSLDTCGALASARAGVSNNVSNRLPSTRSTQRVDLRAYQSMSRMSAARA